MSIMFPASFSRSRRAAFQRQVWGQFFGMLIQGAREEKGRSIEETARLAGMTVSEWEEIEAGRVPSTREQLVSMASALEVDWNGMASLAVLCRRAWGR
jgi:transcriptional regulator with XRE-family HTH domain